MSEPEKTPDAVPQADVKPLGPIASGRVMQSKMWWITLVCLGIAGYLAWHSHRPTGIEIAISFPEGHGLKVGDALQHRGIDIGIVTAVELARDFHGVQTTVSLDESAKGIAVEDSRFWIVRPQLSLTNIRGLETAVGAKYIAVEPGVENSPASRTFAGLKDPPAIGIDAEGVEIKLVGAKSYGINPGSPVTYRGIPVGQIVSMELSHDALHVNVRAKVRTEYAQLLRKGSKFWKTSGFDVDINPLKGIHVHAESLATLAKGGVAFVSPKTRNPDDLSAISPGQEFFLHEKVDEDWVEDAAPIEISNSKD